LRIYLEGGGYINLNQSHYVGGGGEGDVYTKNGVAYKIYHNPIKMIPLGKVTELSVLRNSCFIKPESIIFDKKKNPLGYAMRFVQGGIPLCSIFPPSYRKRHSITHDQIYELIGELSVGISLAHKEGIILVDLNEMNFLVSPDFSSVWFIDADSYQTPSFPGTAIMESIRDWSSNVFTELSDWFSFAVISFQMFTGIHPFRGKYKGPKEQYRKKLPSDTEGDDFAITRRRMKDNISVFDPDVGVPRVAYPFDVIPDDFLDWYKKIFVRGERLLPPTLVGDVIFIAPQITNLESTDRLVVQLWHSFGKDILDIVQDSLGNRSFIKLPGEVFEERRFIHAHTCGQVALTRSGCPIEVFLYKDDGLNKIRISILSNDLTFTDGDRIKYLDVAAESISVYEGNAYAKCGSSIIRIDCAAGKIPIFPHVTDVLPHASYLFSGGVLQNLLGSAYVSLFVNIKETHQIRLGELDGYQIIEAKFDRRVLIVRANKDGKLNRLVFRFADDFSDYDVRLVKDIANVGINFVVLDSGVCVLMDEEENIEVFRSKPGKIQVMKVEDDSLGGDMRLIRWGGKLGFTRGSGLYTLSMKSI